MLFSPPLSRRSSWTVRGTTSGRARHELAEVALVTATLDERRHDRCDRAHDLRDVVRLQAGARVALQVRRLLLMETALLLQIGEHRRHDRADDLRDLLELSALAEAALPPARLSEPSLLSRPALRSLRTESHRRIRAGTVRFGEEGLR